MSAALILDPRLQAEPTAPPRDLSAAARAFAAGGRKRRARQNWHFPAMLGIGILLAMVVAWTAARGLPTARYEVSVPVAIDGDTPGWSNAAEAQTYAEALAANPGLPDPFGVGLDGAATTPPLDPTQLKEQAFVGPPAKAFVFKGSTATDRARAHYCLTSAIYYEAASETEAGMRGVAQVVLNRVRHPSFPNSVCGVVFQGSERAGVCQFTFSCDGSMARVPARDIWARASRIASEALAGSVLPAVGLATHYHTQAIWPRWGKSLVMTNVVGAHIFHRWRGRFGEPAAFHQPYSGRESTPGPYLPVAQQLAALAGKASVPADVAAMAALPPVASVIAPGTVAPTPQAVGGSAAVTASAGPAASAAIAPVAPASATYTDERLGQSGQVRDEFRNSGAWIK